MMKSKNPKPLIVFYALVFYVFLQFGWWAYLIFEMNVEITDLKKEVAVMKAETSQSDLSEFDNALHKKLLMVIGEGSVFLTLLFIGFYQVKKSFMREFSLARQQQNFLLSVTHELNSPLASIKLYLQTLLKRQSIPEEKKEALLNKALLDVERQSKLVNNILLAAKLEDNSFQFKIERINLSRTIEQLIQNHPQDTHKVEKRIDSDVLIDADLTAIQSIFINLYENTLKYGSPEQPVEIAVEKQAQNAVLTIKNHGTTIPENELNQIFEKFYRLGDENTRNSKGTGLGLFLVKFFTDAMGGKIKAASTSSGETAFTVYFKLNN
jgi:signal transduction histidine kinase